MKIKNIKEKVLTLLLGCAVVFAYSKLSFPCLFRVLLHIDCPGCGMTRAYLSLLRLDFSAAFTYHPMFWSVPILLLLYFFDGRLFRQKWLNISLFAIIMAGFFINWILKLLGV